MQYHPARSTDQHGHASRIRGFTLLELLITLAVAAILVTIAVPSYRAMVQRNAVAASANNLVGDLNYARSEAVTRGQTVIVCQSANQDTCTTSANGWTQGWIVYAPTPGTTAVTADNRLRVHAGLDAQVQIAANGQLQNNVAFDANGFARQADGSLGNGTLTVSAEGDNRATRIRIANSGRIRTEAGSDT